MDTRMILQEERKHIQKITLEVTYGPEVLFYTLY